MFVRELPFVIKDKNNGEVIKKFTYEINEKIKINKAIFHEIKVEEFVKRTRVVNWREQRNAIRLRLLFS